jgi:hypothetical protein
MGSPWSGYDGQAHRWDQTQCQAPPLLVSSPDTPSPQRTRGGAHGKSPPQRRRRGPTTMHYGAEALGKPPGSVRVRRGQRRHTLRAGCPRMRQASRFESGRATSVASACEGRGGWGHGASLPVRQALRWSSCRWRTETHGRLGLAASQPVTTRSTGRRWGWRQGCRRDGVAAGGAPAQAHQGQVAVSPGVVFCSGGLARSADVQWALAVAAWTRGHSEGSPPLRDGRPEKAGSGGTLRSRLGISRLQSTSGTPSASDKPA